MLVDFVKIKEVFLKTKTIAVVGLSPKGSRPSNEVARYLMDVGYKVIPVNPGQEEILGERCFATLRDVPVSVDLVDIFRKPESVGPIVADAVAVGAKTIWMQEGIVNEEAASTARRAGLFVVMDRCIKTDHAELIVS